MTRGRAPRSAVSRAWTSTLAVLALARAAPALQAVPPTPGEGALQNDVFLPTSQEAEKHLSAGDAAWQRFRGRASDTAARTTAFESWHEALTVAAPGDAVRALLPVPPGADAPSWPDPDHSASRRTEAVEVAVLRRLRAIDDEGRAAFVARFEPVAALDLAHAGFDLDKCARVEHAHPLTPAAVQAALRVADASLEVGRAEMAAGWLERARTHLAGVADERRAAELRAAIDRRAAIAQPAAPAPVDAWNGARELVPIASEVLPQPTMEQRARTDELPRTGIAIARGGALAVQTAERIHWLDGTGARTSIDPLELASAFSWNWIPAIGRASSDVPMRPITDGERIWTTIGRSQSDRGNTLVCIAIGDARAKPSIVWGYWNGGYREPRGREVPLADVLGPGLWSFEPGALLVGPDLVVSARQWIADTDSGGTIDEGNTRAWCLCLDAATGSLRWSRPLATGPDARFDPALNARLRSPRGLPGPAQPLVRVGSRILVGTEVGAACCLDLCDGRPVWSFENQRESAGSRARVVAPRVVDAGIVLWSPGDSRFSYLLRLGSDEAILAAPPWPSGDVHPWAGGSPRSLVGVARRGARSAPVEVDPIAGRVLESWPFATEEVAGDACGSPARALIATDRALYLLDRTRGLALLDREALSGSGGPPKLEVRGSRVWVASPKGLWIFEAR